MGLAVSWTNILRKKGTLFCVLARKCPFDGRVSDEMSGVIENLGIVAHELYND